MKTKKSEIGIMTGMAVMLIILTPILNPFITAGLGAALIIICLTIHYARLKKNYPKPIKTTQEQPPSKQIK